MFGLFSVGSIEDYYETENLVAVSPDRSKLEKYVSDTIADYELHKLAYDKYCEIRRTMPKLDEVAPVKTKLGFTPKTRDEHKLAERNSSEYHAAYKSYCERSQAFERKQDEAAYLLMCRQEELWQTDVRKSDIIGYQTYHSPPEYKITEVEVW